MAFPPVGFSDYIAPNCDRKKFIEAYLAERGVDTVTISLAGKNHIYVKFPTSHYNPLFKFKTIIAHYDRVKDSPGANDNSAADFCLMDLAVRISRQYDSLSSEGAFHNVRIVFTDGEELGYGGVAEQGAFSLAQLFKKFGMRNDDIFVFDCMGRGTVPVLGKNIFNVLPPLEFQKRLDSLEKRAENILRESCRGRWLSLPLSYSDNAGFMAVGFPAVAITMLPEHEADSYMKALIKEKKLEAYVMRRDDAGCFGNTREAENERRRLNALLPNTWQYLHTKYDNAESISPESFELTAKILDEIVQEKIPV